MRHHVAPLLLGLLLAGCGQASPSTSSSTAPRTAPSAPEAVDVATAAATGGRFSAAYAVAVEALPVAAEVGAGYDRDLFDHWVDVDGNGCDARDEVLLTENRADGARVGASCTLVGGRWVSRYDGATTRDPSTFDVDHVVALAEAWGSGAHRWGERRREAFANDLGDPRSLVAVTASSNRSKSDRDPAEWLPQLRRCTYLRHWVVVKTRWRLSVDAAERHALLAAGCGGTVAGRTARVLADGSTADAPRSDRGDYPTASTGGTGRGGGGTGGTGGDGTDPRFGTCGEAVDAGYGPYVRGRDPEYAWYRDADSDGVVCES